METIAKLYDELSDYILAQMPGIRHVDLYNQQYNSDNLEDGIPFERPAVFIEILPILWNTNSDGSQIGDTSINIHTCVDALADTYKNRTGGSDNKSNAHENIDVADLLHIKLQGMSLTNTSSFNRSTTNIDSAHAILMININTYNFKLKDCSTNTLKNEVSPWDADIANEIRSAITETPATIGGFVIPK